MIQDKSKRIFLALSIIVPFLLYCGFYYSGMLKNAPFRYTDFESIDLTFGTPDSMKNHYNSISQDYTYELKDGSLKTEKVKLTDDDLLYLHRKAMELGFWNVDDDMTTPAEARKEGVEVPRFVLEYKYKEKTKKVTLDTDYPGNPRMKEAAQSVIEQVRDRIAVAQAR